MDASRKRGEAGEKIEVMRFNLESLPFCSTVPTPNCSHNHWDKEQTLSLRLVS